MWKWTLNKPDSYINQSFNLSLNEGNICYFKLNKPNTCLFWTQKLAPSWFGLNWFQCNLVNNLFKIMLVFLFEPISFHYLLTFINVQCKAYFCTHTNPFPFLFLPSAINCIQDYYYLILSLLYICIGVTFLCFATCI